MSEQFTYSHPRPIMAADSVVFTVKDGMGHVLLIRRGHGPFEGHWALPGGFVNENEPLDSAAARELREETGLELAMVDYREHSIQGGDDAREARWWPLHALPAIAFDHSKLLAYARNRVRELVAHGDWTTRVPASWGEGDVRAIAE